MPIIKLVVTNVNLSDLTIDINKLIPSRFTKIGMFDAQHPPYNQIGLPLPSAQLYRIYSNNGVFEITSNAVVKLPTTHVVNEKDRFTHAVGKYNIETDMFYSHRSREPFNTAESAITISIPIINICERINRAFYRLTRTQTITTNGAILDDTQIILVVETLPGSPDATDIYFLCNDTRQSMIERFNEFLCDLK